MVVRIVAIEKDTRVNYIQNSWLVTLEKDTGEQKIISVRAQDTPTAEDVYMTLLKSIEFQESNYPPGTSEKDSGIDEYKRALRSWLPEVKS